MTRSEELFFDIRTINNIRKDMACNLLAGTSEYILQFFLLVFKTFFSNSLKTGAYLRKIAHMASTKITFYIYNLLIISPGIHVYVYYVTCRDDIKFNLSRKLCRLVTINISPYNHQL
jgi:hypothetical protein